MTLQHLPTLILGIVVTIYWLYVARMVYRVRQDAGRVQKVLIPAQRREKLMWIIWIPVIGGWFSAPFKVAFGFGNRFDQMLLPASLATSAVVLALRFLAAGVAIACL